MVKSQIDHRVTSFAPSPNGKGVQEPSQDTPPKIPPRMKKKGPALPEKPPHMRAQFSSSPTLASQPQIREPLQPRVLPSMNIDKHQTTQREILVAASKASRERPVEKRQREPAKLLMPTSGEGPTKKEMSLFQSRPALETRLGYNSNTTSRKQLEVSTKFESGKSLGVRKSRPPQPVLLIPRGMLPWGSSPVSYALWMQREAAPGKGVPRREPAKPLPLPQLEPPTRARSSSVTRSGSLTSQGSSSSDSGNETFPKSVLKKQKRNSTLTSSKGNNSTSSRKVEPKKNVTFNAFATVQLMEE